MKQRLFCLIAILSIALIELSIPTHLEAAELTEVADAAEKKIPLILLPMWSTEDISEDLKSQENITVIPL